MTEKGRYTPSNIIVCILPHAMPLNRNDSRHQLEKMGNLKMNVILIYISNFTLYEQSKPGKARMEIE